MKRRSVSGNVTVIEELHRPGPSEPQRVNPTSEVKKRKISSKVYNINYHQTRATCERVTETKTKLLKISKVLEATEKVELTKKEARALVEQYRYFLGYRNVVSIGVHCKKVNGKETTTQALVFKVKKKTPLQKISEPKRIPRCVTFHNKESGESRQIITDVVQVTGRPVQQAMSGDAVYVRDPQDQ